MDAILLDVEGALGTFSSSSATKPPCYWVDQQTVALLQQYPSGISKTVLLTELEYRWRSSLKRGENAGKLKQALTTMQISLGDVLTGNLSKIDEYRCLIKADGVQCGMMLHRQLFDWTMFLQSVGVDAVDGRTCLVTSCRMLNIFPPLLLPTPQLVFLLRLGDPLEAFLIQDVFLILHQAFAQSFVLPHTHIAPHSALQPFHSAGNHTAAYENSSAAGNSDVPLPDNSQTLVIFAEVLGNSAVKQYNVAGAGAGAGGGSADYQLVTLRLCSGDEAAGLGGIPSSATNGGGNASRSSLPACIAYLILFDDQVSLSRMWGAGDLLLVYRPYLRANAEEETIFGAHRPGALSNPAHTMAYDVVQRADPSLYEQLPPPSPSAALSFANYHLLYGSVTVISKIEFPGAGGGGGAGQGITLRSSSITPRLTQQPQHSPHSRLLCPVLGRLIGVFLCKRNYNNGCSNGIIGVNGRASDGDPVVELWVQALGSAGRESVGTGSEGRNAPKSPTVLRVRYLANMYPAMRSMTGFPGFQNEGSCVVGSNTAEQPADDVTERLRCLPTAQAGQLVSISGLRALHLSTLHLHPALQQQQWNEQRPPPPSVAGYLLSAYPQLLHCALEVLNCGFSDIGGNIVDPAATSCLFEPNAAVYMHATAASLPTMDDSREGGLADPSVLALCSLPALACSPSLQLPIPLQQALALAHTPTSGAILVHASIQPLHPSVRLCCPPGLEGARSSSNSSISTSGSHPVADPRTAQAPEAAAVDDASTAVVLGYQLMRLRDASGDALCVVESNVLALIRSRRDTGGDNMLQPPQPQWEVQEVRHRLVNTTSTLYLDSSTGQLVRLQQQQHSSTSTTSSSSSASFSLLLSRIDDGVHSSLLGAIALCSNNSSGKVGSAHLPAFRIEAICDANPAAIEALRPAHPYQSK